jgi:uncharacterized membrane protein affecting hemolysin expression
MAGAVLVVAVGAVLAAALGALGVFRGAATAQAGRDVAGRLVRALQTHDAATATALLCTADPATERLASSGLRFSRDALVLDAGLRPGSTRRELVYRLEGAAGVRALGVDVVSHGSTRWCVVALAVNPPGDY